MSSPAYLSVQGASLYYEMRGTGPVLLVLQGGDGDADGMASLVGHLTAHFSVVTYDRRGLGRSKLDPGSAPPSVTTHAEDAAELLRALVGPEPSLVFGASLGGMVGLELVSRHPELVHRLLAHEPPATQFLPAGEREQASQAQLDVEEIHRREGLIAAMGRFALLTGRDLNDREPDVQIPTRKPQRAQNLQFFLAHDAPAVRLHRLDEARLRVAADRVLVGVGASSAAHLPGRCATELARWLRRVPIELPGGHNGFVTHPRALAARLREALLSRSCAEVPSGT